MGIYLFLTRRDVSNFILNSILCEQDKLLVIGNFNMLNILANNAKNRSLLNFLLKL